VNWFTVSADIHGTLRIHVPLRSLTNTETENTEAENLETENTDTEEHRGAHAGRHGC
jgi:hypothetical protein